MPVRKIAGKAPSYFSGQFQNFINAYCEHIYHANAKKGFWDTNREQVEEQIRSLGFPTLSDLTIEHIGNVVQKGRSNAEALALIHSEISEALEGDRKNKMDDHLPHRTSMEVELADAVIRIFDLAGARGLDLGGAIIEKLEYNTKRPHLHGDGKRY